jgi:hypothetical protein
MTTKMVRPGLAAHVPWLLRRDGNCDGVNRRWNAERRLGLATDGRIDREVAAHGGSPAEPISAGALALSETCAIRTEILGNAEDFIRVWQSIAKLRRSLSSEGDVLTDPIHFLTDTDSTRRPHAVACWMGDDLIGILFATCYHMLGVPTGYAFSGDFTGRGSLLARPEHKALIIEAAVCCLMRNGVHSLRMRIDSAASMAAVFPDCHVQQFADRVPGDRLALPDTYDGFLSTLGKHTRRNIRYYTRRAITAGIVFDSQASDEDYAAAIDQLNRVADFPNTNLELERAKRLLALHGGSRFLLRDQSGEAIAALSGFSKEGRFYLLAQLNHGQLRNLSLSLVLRGRVIDHLIATGHTELQFMDSSSRSLGRFCAPQDHCTLFVDRRRSIMVPFKMLVGRAIDLFASCEWPVPTVMEPLSGSFLTHHRLAACTAIRHVASPERETKEWVMQEKQVAVSQIV